MTDFEAGYQQGVREVGEFMELRQKTLCSNAWNSGRKIGNEEGFLFGILFSIAIMVIAPILLELLRWIIHG